jgi:hypothetical protein
MVGPWLVYGRRRNLPLILPVFKTGQKPLRQTVGNRNLLKISPAIPFLQNL